MTNWEYLKSLSTKEFAENQYFNCPYECCNKNIIDMSDTEAESTCCKCIDEWLNKEVSKED